MGAEEREEREEREEEGVRKQIQWRWVNMKGERRKNRGAIVFERVENDIQWGGKARKEGKEKR